MRSRRQNFRRLCGRRRSSARRTCRHHARIVIDRGHAHVEDLGSKNGTFVGGKPVTDARVLRDGDEIRVGPVALTFSVAPTTQATETMTQTAGGIASRKSRDAGS